MDSRFRTTVLLAVLTLLIVWIGHFFGGSSGMLIALMLAALMNLGSYWFSDRLVLAMYRAQPLDQRQAPDIYRMVRELAAEANHSHAPDLLDSRGNSQRLRYRPEPRKRPSWPSPKGFGGC